MGDNRNDSEDSRFDAVGFVPEQNLVGRAAFIWLNWAFPSSPQWRRIGTRIR
jgi:signal peptidase I